MATYERSPFIAERRRTLFPTDDHDMDSELGTPLSSDHSDTEVTTKAPSPGFSHNYSMSLSESMSPLRLSPYTPKKATLLCNIKTPHDSNIKPILEKEQKVLTEESKSLGPKPRTPLSSPEGPKTDTKVSRVRTALFSSKEDGLPAKSFYSKEVLEGQKRLSAVMGPRTQVLKPQRLSNGAKSRPHSSRRFGQINNGVRHNIRKPKPKKRVSAPVRKVQPNGAILTEYLQDLSELRPDHKKKLIKTFTESEENKENVSSPSSRPAKRAISPEEVQTRKFFKSSDQRRPVESLNPSNDFPEDDSETAVNIDNILSLLSSPTKEVSSQVIFSEALQEDPSTANQITLLAHSSVSASENSIQLHLSDSILSPISQMCDVTSGLALDSPTTHNVSARINCSARVSKMLSFNDSADMAESVKLFPIFCKDKNNQAHQEKRSATAVDTRNGAKRLRKLPPDQMLLDAGQKKFGLTLCNVCETVYHIGDPNDELEHSKYHRGYHVLKFPGWKNERIVADFQAKGRIIKVMPHDSATWLAKVKNLMVLVNRELGCCEMDSDNQSQVYLYIKSRMIVGCAVAAVPKGPAYRMLNSIGGVAMCSEESYPVKCGVASIWVDTAHRKQGIASALLDAIKTTFVLGEVLTDQDMALSTPTEAGSCFAEKYFKTPNYLVYFT